MIELCYRYSTKWRYEYNVAKCAIIVFHESDEDFITRRRTWKLGSETINECERYVHLGVVFNRKFSLTDCVEESCKKLRGTFFSLVNSGINRHGLNPLTSKTIYNTVVIPRALYGSELWCDLQQRDITRIEVAHRCCLKYMQDLGVRTKTDLVYRLLNMHAIEYEIDKSKLRLFGQLCNLPCDKLAKEIFLNRLTNYEANASTTCGFIPDVCSILRKYSLFGVLNGYKRTGIFMSKFQWKRCVKLNIDRYEQSRLREVRCDDMLSNYLCNSSSPSVLWTMSMENRNYLKMCRSTAKVLGQYFYNDFRRICSKCGISTEKLIMHICYECRLSEPHRLKLLTNIMHICGDDMLTKFVSLDLHQQLCSLLGSMGTLRCDDDMCGKFLKIAVNFVHKLATVYGIV